MAAEKGNSAAMYEAGIFYVKCDNILCIKYLGMAMKKKNSSAIYALAMYYNYKQNYNLAKRYYCNFIMEKNIVKIDDIDKCDTCAFNNRFSRYTIYLTSIDHYMENNCNLRIIRKLIYMYKGEKCLEFTEDEILDFTRTYDLSKYFYDDLNRLIVGYLELPDFDQ